MSLEIPKQAERALGLFVGFSQEKVKLLVEALTQAPPTLFIADLASSISDKVGLTAAEATTILELFAGMHLARTNANKGVEEFTDDLCLAIKEQIDEGLKVQDWEQVKTNIVGVLSAERSLGVTAKAIDVMTEYERVFQHVRILSDIRPIFATDAAEKPSAALIVHNLNINFRNASVGKQISFAMDSNDLKMLKRVIERAEAKEETLKNLLKGDGLVCLESK